MPPRVRRNEIVLLLAAAAIIGGCFFGSSQGQNAVAQSQLSDPPEPELAVPALSDPSEPELAVPARAVLSPGVGTTLYIPLLNNEFPWRSPFGVESYGPLVEGSAMLTRARELNVGWMRLGLRVSWRELQPAEGAPIQWEKLAQFEQELRALRAAGISPVVIIYDSPYWATVTREDGMPTSCAAIRSDKFGHFALFVRSLVNRYKSNEFNVHNWEIGNEPDIDPDEVPIDNGFGCWGDNSDDLYFGGIHYGDMLKILTPLVKEEDPSAQIWIGGLLLAFPYPPETAEGEPRIPHAENYLRGILKTGGGPYFDVVPFHFYPSYYRGSNGRIDYDLKSFSAWDNLGGGITGKVNHIRTILQEYGVDKPIVLNEIALGCQENIYCPAPDDLFHQAQADFLVRTFVRALSQKVAGVSWYTLEGPAWRSVGLMDGANPKPNFLAYKNLVQQLQNSKYLWPVDYSIYSSEIEAYAFRKGAEQIHILWTRSDQAVMVPIPQSLFVQATTRDGALITPTLDGPNVLLPVGFSPIYIELLNY